MVESNALQAFLTLLSPDPVEAAENYRRMQHRLVRFFLLTAASDPQQLTDETISRLAQRVAEAASAVPAGEPDDQEIDGQPPAIESPATLLASTARQVLHEDLAKSQPNDQEVREWFGRTINAPDRNRGRRLSILQSCLSRLTPDRRRLLESYYGWKPSHKAEHHRQLAQSLGISSEALCNRVLHLRVQLESCVRKKKGTSESKGRRS